MKQQGEKSATPRGSLAVISGTTSNMSTEEELKAQIARLNSALDSLTTKVVERDATIERLEHRYTRLVRLEIAARLLGLNY
jgi:hypothetical protein